ncbi:MAG: PspC domain-containing protein [Coriobacteriia bacterium]|nr:PspC domain-containing protein [Coriobacteriia bacterium]
MRRVWSVGREISGPIALIILGAAILYYSRRGGFRAPARGQRLYRSRDQKMVAGVMGGLASYLGTDPTVLRLVTVAVAIFTPLPVVLAYIVAAIIVPLEPEAGAPRAPAAPPTRPPG